MIPKTIHYCWFGGNEKPKLFKKCYKSWKKYCPDYEIVEWNESNFDLTSCPLYVRQAYEAKKWAFVTDYVRLKVIYDNGGIYFDTDVELKKNPDFLLEYKAFFGFEDSGYVNTGIGFGAEKGTAILLEMLKDYEDIAFIKDDGSFDLTTCPIRNTQAFLKHGLVQDGSKQVIEDNILVLSKLYMCPLEYTTGEDRSTEYTVSVHWFSASWYTKEEHKIYNKQINKYRFIRFIYRIFPNELVDKAMIGISKILKI